MNLNFTWKMWSFELHNVDVGWNLRLAIFSLFFTKSKLTSALWHQISQNFTKKFQKLISWIQRKGFEDDIQKFWLTWHYVPGSNRVITAGGCGLHVSKRFRTHQLKFPAMPLEFMQFWVILMGACWLTCPVWYGAPEWMTAFPICWHWVAFPTWLFLPRYCLAGNETQTIITYKACLNLKQRTQTCFCRKYIRWKLF